MKKENKLFFVPLVGKTSVCRQKEGLKPIKDLPLLPRLTAGLPPQGREMCSGFTLIELLVVVLIIGILAAIALPQYQKAVKRAKYAEMLSITKQLSLASERYYLEHGTHPTSLNQLDVSLTPSKGIYISINSSIQRIWVTVGGWQREGNGYAYLQTPYGYYRIKPGLYCFQAVGYAHPDGMCQGSLVEADAYGSLYKVN